MTDHTLKAYDEELRTLTQKILRMGGLCEAQLTDAITGLANSDVTLAQRAVSNDGMIDLLQHEIEDKALLIIARRQPVAVDLREIVGAMRIAGDLERIGDLAKNIGKRVTALEGKLNMQKLAKGVIRMADLAALQLKAVLDSYGQRDPAKALAVWRSDEDIDNMYNSVLRELLTYMMEDSRTITFCTHLLFCAKNVERIGDHCTNIAETVHFVATGVQLTDDRPKKDTYHITG